MSRLGELMALFLQESEETERNKSTIVDLLTERAMDSGGRLRRRKSLHQRLGLKNMVCCGSTWGFGVGTSSISTQANNSEEDDDNNEDDVIESTQQQMDMIEVNLTHPDIGSDPGCTLQSPRMNLADALAAERYFRSTNETGSDYVLRPSSPEKEVRTPLRKSLMRLLEETEAETEEGQDEGMNRDQMCCVCMGRKKGAALIPCGHTYCRVCCRELWLNRGSCPLCNRSILEILDIY